VRSRGSAARRGQWLRGVPERGFFPRVGSPSEFARGCSRRGRGRGRLESRWCSGTRWFCRLEVYSTGNEERALIPHCFQAESFDDLLREVLDTLCSEGGRIRPSRGEAFELIGATIELENPRARLSRTETRGKLFSCLGELCWYLSGKNTLDPIRYYIPRYEESAEGDLIFGGYGPRLFDWKGQNQLANIRVLLEQRQDSRRAVIQLFDAVDLAEEHKDVPCTTAIQFFKRADLLHACVTMRSNDVFFGLSHDLFCFTMLQEILAVSLGVQPGTYKHFVGSLHVYAEHKLRVNNFLSEGWQSSCNPMPPMPCRDPWPSIDFLLEAEATIREGHHFDLGKLDKVESYWADLVRLLLIFRYGKERAVGVMEEVAATLVAPCYRLYVEQYLARKSELEA